MNAIVFVVLLGVQPDTLLVEVSLAETQQHVLMTAVLEPDSTLRLPAANVHQLLGLGAPAARWLTVESLQAQYPTTRVVWLPRELRVVIFDPMRVFPASRSAHQQIVAGSRLAFNVPAWSGPFASVAANERGAYVSDFGYSWRSRVSVTLRESSALGSAWGVTVAPSARFNVSYADGEYMPPTATVRVAAGPAWTFATWTPARWSVDGLLQVGRVSLFASSRDVYAITINAVPVGVQVGRQGRTTTARLTYGPIQPSPFGPPVVP